MCTLPCICPGSDETGDNVIQPAQRTINNTLYLLTTSDNMSATGIRDRNIREVWGSKKGGRSTSLLFGAKTIIMGSFSHYSRSLYSRVLHSHTFPPLVLFSVLALYLVEILVSDHTMDDKGNLHKQIIWVLWRRMEGHSAATLIRMKVMTRDVHK